MEAGQKRHRRHRRTLAHLFSASGGAADRNRNRARRVLEAAADVRAAAARKERLQAYAMKYKQLQQERRDAMVLPTRDWIKRAKTNILSGHGHVSVGEQRCCRLGRQNAEKGHKEEPSTSSNVDFLPLHLVFSRLPLRQLFQLRCVCKHWNLMLRGAALAMLKEEEEYWFVLSQALPCDERIWNFRAFSNLDWAFFGLPLPGCSLGKLFRLLGGMGCSLLPQLEDTCYVGRCHPRLVSAGGLMCAFVHKPDALDDYSVIVFNCLTGSVKVLPPLQDPCYLSRRPGTTALGCRMHMAVDDQDPARYYILLTHELYIPCSYTKFYFEVFDSKRGCWRVGQSPETATLVASEVPKADFFFIKGEAVFLGYNASDDVWSEVYTRPIYDGVGCMPTFLKYKGRLLRCVQVNGTDYSCVGFAVRELRPSASEWATWVEVARTPVHLLEGISYLDWYINIRAEGSLFYMTFEDFKLQGQCRPPLVYDIAKNLWYFLPSETGSVNFGCISVLRPRLSLCQLHI